MSLTASGTIGKALTFSKWKGVPYARTRVIPANPKSTAQQEVRGVFSTLTEMWKRMDYLARNPFILAVRGQAMTARNKHIQVNTKILIDKATLNDLVMSVSTGQAVPPTSAAIDVLTPLNIIITPVAPTVPTGYTLYGIRAAAVLDGDPSPVITRITYSGQNIITPYEITIVVPAAGTYQVGTWCVYTRDSDDLAFESAALRAQAEVVAE